MAAIISDVTTDIETQLGTISGLTVFPFPPKSGVPPFAFVNLPEEITYDATFGRGQDRFTLDVYVCTGAVLARDSADALTAWAAGDASGVKHAIEASTNYDYRVVKASFVQVSLAAASYAGVVFTVDIGA